MISIMPRGSSVSGSGLCQGFERTRPINFAGWRRITCIADLDGVCSDRADICIYDSYVKMIYVSDANRMLNLSLLLSATSSMLSCNRTSFRYTGILSHTRHSVMIVWSWPLIPSLSECGELKAGECALWGFGQDDKHDPCERPFTFADVLWMWHKLW